MKINENSVIIPQNSGLAKANPSSNSASNNVGANKVADAVSTGPAVNLDISLTAKLAEVQSDTASKLSDQALIEKLRNQIANGELKIDYKKISQSMLKEAVAAIGQKPKQA